MFFGAGAASKCAPRATVQAWEPFARTAPLMHN